MQKCRHCDKQLIRSSELKAGDDPCTCYASVAPKSKADTAVKNLDKRPDSAKALDRRPPTPPPPAETKEAADAPEKKSD